MKKIDSSAISAILQPWQTKNKKMANMLQRLSPLAAFLLTGWLLAGLAAAGEFDDNANSCTEDKADPGSRIEACTWLLQSGRLGKSSYSAVYYNRGIAYDIKGQYDQAIQDYGEVIRRDPSDAVAYNNRGNVYSTKRQYDRAIRDFDEAIRLKPGYALAYYNRGLAHGNKRQFDRAIQDYSETIRLNPRFASAYNNRGAAYSRKDQYDRAILDYDEAIRLNPRNARAYNNRGSAYDDKGQYDHAIRDFGEAIRLNPRYARAYSNRGIAHKNKGQIDQAIRDYEQAIRLDPKYATPLNALAWLLATASSPGHRDGPRAVMLAERAAEISKTPNALDTLAAAYAEAGRFRDAQAAQQRAIDLLHEEGASQRSLADHNVRLELYRRGQPYRKN